MCGLVAIVSGERPVEPGAVEAALQALRHRGPDGSGTWVGPDGRVALGHSRLAIIDRAGGAQPIASEDGALVLALNGELYDFERTRQELEARGHRFRTGSDSEIALHLYEERGSACLDALRGEFAFVLWDGRKRQLFAARDRFGIKPLVWALHGGALFVASEAKALFAAGVPAAWDHEAFAHAMAHQYLPPERSLFRGVAQLPPGHLLVGGASDVRIARYWDLDLPAAAQASAEPTEPERRQAALEVRARLDEAVRLRLRADVPVAFYLSGGLDSSAVLALAARASDGPLHAFSVCFAHAPYDERALAEEMAAGVGAVLHPVVVGQDDLVDALPAAVRHGEGLAINGQLPAKYLLAEAVRAAGFEVVLSGEGADEAFLGYPHLVRDHALATNGGAADEALDEALGEAHRASSGVMLPRGTAPSLGAVRERLGSTPTFLQAKAQIGLALGPLLAPDFAARARPDERAAHLLASFDVDGQLAERHPVDQARYLWTKLALAGYILRTLGDACEMAHGVEGRLPFLDHLLFEHARALPLGMAIRDGVEKTVLRDAVRDLVPARIAARPKHPFLAPPLAVFASPRLATLVGDTLGSAAFASLPFFDRARVRRWLDALPSLGTDARRAADPLLMTLVTAALLQSELRPAAG